MKIKTALLIVFVLSAVLVVPAFAQDGTGAAVPVSVEFLTGLSAAVLSLLFTYVPSLRKWFDGLAADTKRQVMGALLVVLSLSVFSLGCLGLADDLGIGIACQKADLIGLGKILYIALTANQTTFLLSPKI